jgi:hypothetical protein
MAMCWKIWILALTFRVDLIDLVVVVVAFHFNILVILLVVFLPTKVVSYLYFFFSYCSFVLFLRLSVMFMIHLQTTVDPL